MPEARPISTAQKTPSDEYVNVPTMGVVAVNSLGSMNAMMKYASTAIRPAAPNSPMLSARCGLPPSFTLTKNEPRMETTMPTAAMTSGSRTAPNSMPPASTRAAANAAPSTIAPMIEPTYDSNRSAPMPATSPTLSPTLSAMVAGLRGSSSGMPS